MSDLGTKGGVASAHEAQPVTDGTPTSVATTTAPKGEVYFGFRSEGVGGSNAGAH